MSKGFLVFISRYIHSGLAVQLLFYNLSYFLKLLINNLNLQADILVVPESWHKPQFFFLEVESGTCAQRNKLCYRCWNVFFF